MLKQYIIFAGEWYYPKGGWNDFLFSTDNKKQALKIAKAFIEVEDAWAQVIDSNTGRIEFEGHYKSGVEKLEEVVKNIPQTPVSTTAPIQINRVELPIVDTRTKR